MSAAEKKRMNEILLQNDGRKSYICRINAGSAWTAGPRDTEYKGKIITLKNARRFIGAPPGWPDLAGYQSVTITPDMVGKTVAIFTGHEIKMTGKLNAKQKIFRDRLIRMGGRFIVDRPDGCDIINGWELQKGEE